MKTIPVSSLVAGMLLPTLCLAEPMAPVERPQRGGEKSGSHPPRPFVEAWDQADNDHDGKISETEFHLILRIQGLPEEKRSGIFKRLDKDGDHFLVRDELLRLGRPRDDRPPFRLWELDADKSGGISMEEFKQGSLFKKLPANKLEVLFTRLDTDSDGVITPKDKPEPPSMRGKGKKRKGPQGGGEPDDAGRLERMIRKADANGDGKLTFAEFRAGPGVKDLTEDEQEDRFEKFDRNGDKEISREDNLPKPPPPRE